MTDMQTATVVLDPATRDRVKALTKCAGAGTEKSRAVSRAVLTTVAFDHEYAWATDSYVLARVPLETGLPSQERPEWLVDAKALDKALSALSGSKSHHVRLTLGNEGLTVERGSQVPGEGFRPEGSKTVLDWSKGSFPDVRSLLPDSLDEHGPVEAFTSFARVAKVEACAGTTTTVKGIHMGKPPIVRLWQNGDKPLVVQTPDEEIVGLVMPVVV